MSASQIPAAAVFSGIRSRAFQYLSQLTSAAGPNPVGEVLLTAGLHELLPWGWQGTGRRVANSFRRSARIAADHQAHMQVDSLVAEARALAGSYSISDATLRTGPNSARLVRRLGRGLDRDRGSPAIRLRALIGAIDSMASLQLTPNHELGRVVESHAFQRIQERTTRSAPELAQLIRASSGPQDPAYYEARLAFVSSPREVRESLDGALRRLREGGPDAFRQGAASVRAALEGLLTSLTGEGHWATAATRLVTDRNELGVVKRLHRLLSRDAHAGHKTCRADLQLDLDLFGVVAARLIELGAAHTPAGG